LAEAEGFSLQPLQARDCRAKMRGHVVPELQDERMTVERRLHDSPLHASAPAMNETDFVEASPGRSGYVFFDHGRDIARGKGMKIKFSVNGNFMHHGNFKFQMQTSD
jgi:hypothetical protein